MRKKLLKYFGAEDTFPISFSSGIAVSVSYTQEYQTVLDFANNESTTTPSEYDNTIINYFISELKSKGYWTPSETINIYGFGSIQFGTLNIKNPATKRHTSPQIASIIFSRDGVKSDLSTNSYFNTNYNLSESNHQDYTVIFYVSESSAELISNNVFGARASATNSNIQKTVTPRNSGGNMKFWSYSADRTRSSSNHKGLYCLVGKQTQSILYKDYLGISGIRDINPSVPVAQNTNNQEYFLAYNSSTNGGSTPAFRYNKNTQMIMRINRGLTDSEVIEFTKLWETFLFMK